MGGAPTDLRHFHQGNNNKLRSKGGKGKHACFLWRQATRPCHRLIIIMKSIILKRYNKNNFVIKQKRTRQKSMYKCMIRYNSFPMGELLFTAVTQHISV